MTWRPIAQGLFGLCLLLKPKGGPLGPPDTGERRIPACAFAFLLQVP